MMSQNQWADWSVKHFFSGYNWLGKPPKFTPPEATEATVEPDSWLSFSVRDFLKQNNWTGQPLAKRQHHSQTSQTATILDTTLPVSEFFRFLVWQGNTTITPAPTVAPTPTPIPLSPPSHDLNLNHLSDLF